MRYLLILWGLLAGCTSQHCEQWAEEVIRAHEEAGHMQAFVLTDPEGEAVVWLDSASNATITEGVVWAPEFAAHLEKPGWTQTGTCLMPPEYTVTASTWKWTQPIPTPTSPEYTGGTRGAP